MLTPLIITFIPLAYLAGASSMLIFLTHSSKDTFKSNVHTVVSSIRRDIKVFLQFKSSFLACYNASNLWPKVYKYIIECLEIFFARGNPYSTKSNYRVPSLSGSY